MSTHGYERSDRTLRTGRNWHGYERSILATTQKLQTARLVPQNHKDLRPSRPLQRIRVRPLDMRVQEHLGSNKKLLGMFDTFGMSEIGWTWPVDWTDSTPDEPLGQGLNDTENRNRVATKIRKSSASLWSFVEVEEVVDDAAPQMRQSPRPANYIKLATLCMSKTRSRESHTLAHEQKLVFYGRQAARRPGHARTPARHASRRKPHQ